MKTFQYAMRFLLRARSYTLINLLDWHSAWPAVLCCSVTFTANIRLMCIVWTGTKSMQSG